MEEKLELMKKMMELEKDKRSGTKNMNDGSKWRSATTEKQLAGYSKLVLDRHKQNQPGLPPTNLVTDPVTGKTSQIPQRAQKQMIPTAKPPSAQRTQHPGQPIAGNAAPTQKTGQAADNLKSALETQNHSYPEVAEFLSSLNLQKY